MRTLLFVLSVSAFFLIATSYELRCAEPAAWPGFPALENGDVNSDGEIDLSDAVSILGWLYLGGPGPAPVACRTAYSTLSSGDTNGDGEIDLSDSVHLLGFLFKGGPSPANACAVRLGLGEGGSAGRPRILPAHSSAYGKTLAEWTAAWWRWAISIPTDAHPLFDT